MTFFLWSDDGCLLFLGMRLKKEGHRVQMYTKAPNAQDVGKGLIDRSDGKTVPKGAVIIFDGVGHGAVGDYFRSQGHAVIGGNSLDKKLEADRPEGLKIMREVGLSTPESKSFTEMGAAKAFLKDHEGHWYVKVTGSQAEDLTYDAEQTEELLRYLQWAEEHLGKSMKEVVLQKEVKGTELSMNGWFDGKKWVGPFDFTIEEKRFLTGNLGPRTGCESNLVWACHPESWYPAATLDRMGSYLEEAGYVGLLDLNAIVMKDRTVKGLEWTARFGFDATAAWFHLIEGTVGELLTAFAHGDLGSWPLSSEYAMTLRLSLPPYPTYNVKEAKLKQGFPLYPQLLDMEYATVDDVMVGPQGLVLAGRDGFLGTVGEVGTDFSDLRASVLDKADRVRHHLRSLQYRIDPVSRADRDLSELRRLKIIPTPLKGQTLAVRSAPYEA